MTENFKDVFKMILAGICVLFGIAAFFGIMLYFQYTSSRYHSDDNFAEINRASHDKAMSDTMLALFNSDVVSCNPLWSETELIANTVEKDIKYHVTFYYQQDDGKNYGLNPISRKEMYMNDLEFRESVRIGLSNKVMAQAQEYSLASGEIIACLLTWEGKDFWGNETCEPTLCDLDCDGDWDYLMDGSTYFYSQTSDYVDSRVLDEYNTLYLGTKGKAISLSGLTGHETFLDFEKLLLEEL